MAIFSKLRCWLPKIVDRLLQLRFIKFGIVGFLGTLVNLGILALGQEYLFASIADPGLRLNLSLALAISIAILHNFIWNRRWTWKDRTSSATGILPQFGRYIFASTFGIILQFLLTKALALHLHYLLANVASVILTAVANYLLNNIWTFSLKRS